MRKVKVQIAGGVGSQMLHGVAAGCVHAMSGEPPAVKTIVSSGSQAPPAS